MYSPRKDGAGARGQGPRLWKSLPNFNLPPSPKKLYTYIGAGREEPTSISVCDSQENVRNPSPKKSEATRKPQNQNSPPHHLAAPFRAPSWEFSPLDQKNHGESIEALRSAHVLQIIKITCVLGAFQRYLRAGLATSRGAVSSICCLRPCHFLHPPRFSDF